jgi:hypothetical protein
VTPAGSVVVNADNFISGVDEFEERFQRMFRDKVRRLVYEGMFRLTRKTPVNTGQAVMNYVATGGAPYNGPPRSAGKAVEATNKLPIGSEKLRGAATAISVATLAGVDFSDPYKTFWISNNTPHIGGLESGSLPEAPYRPRSPAGMFAVTVQELMSLLQSQSI